MIKEKFLIIILVVLLLIALSYIGWQFWIGISNSIFRTGYSSAVEQLMTTAENEKCEPFPIFLGEKTIYLINVKCLEEQTGEQSTP